jgi:hypothetical protein
MPDSQAKFQDFQVVPTGLELQCLVLTQTR